MTKFSEAILAIFSAVSVSVFFCTAIASAMNGMRPEWANASLPSALVTTEGIVRGVPVSKSILSSGASNTHSWRAVALANVTDPSNPTKILSGKALKEQQDALIGLSNTIGEP